MSTLYERWDSPGDNLHAMYTKYYLAQTFTVGNTGDNVSHNITGIKLRMRYVDAAWNFIVSIRAVDGAGNPTGPNLTSTVVNSSELTTNIAWIEITLPQYKLDKNTKYAIVIGAPDAPGGGGGIVEWSRSTGHGYTGGNWVYSSDYGVTWIPNLSREFTFYEYGLYNRVKTGKGQNKAKLFGKRSNRAKLSGKKE